MGQRGKDQFYCGKKLKAWNLWNWLTALGFFFPCSFHSADLKLTLTGWLHLLPPPLGGRMWVQLLFVSPDCPCANTAVMSWGEKRLITDCSVFLPVPLGDPYTVNWMTTPRGLNCWWDWPLPHKNSITYQKIVLITFSLMQHSSTTPLFTILDFTVSRYVTKLA